MTKSFWQDKKVLVTGDTGFKGTWLCKILEMLGAEVIGYALESPTQEGTIFFKKSVASDMRHIHGDIRDLNSLRKVFADTKPEIVFHLAAQPLVLQGYQEPVFTFATNVMGTVNVLECIRTTDSVRSFLNVTTDKVYENKEWCWGYRENDSLDGFDPYSNSKSCSELVTHSYKKSFFADGRCRISTARAGNVIGGGDFAENRIIPDCIRSVIHGKTIHVRNPYSIRPYQHVLEPLSAYLMIAEKQVEDESLADSYNVGPDENSCLPTGKLAELFCQIWRGDAAWRTTMTEQPHEARCLKLDTSKIRTKIGWYPQWKIEMAIKKTIELTKWYYQGRDLSAALEKQIKEYFCEMS